MPPLAVHRSRASGEMVCAPVVCLLTLGVAAATPLTRLIGLRGGGSPVQLIDATGSLNKGAAAEAAAGASSDLTLIASVGAQARGRRLLNDLFGTEFSTGASDSGAWLAVEGSLAVLATQGSATAAEVRDGADANKLASFSLTLAGAVLVHTPSTPTDAQLQASYESLFAQRAALKESAQQKLLLLHVGEVPKRRNLPLPLPLPLLLPPPLALTPHPHPSPHPHQGEEAAVRKACAAAWKAVSGQAAAAFDEQYELDVAPLPHRTHEATAYATALEVPLQRLEPDPNLTRTLTLILTRVLTLTPILTSAPPLSLTLSLTLTRRSARGCGRCRAASSRRGSAARPRPRGAPRAPRSTPRRATLPCASACWSSVATRRPSRRRRCALPFVHPNPYPDPNPDPDH